MVISERDRLSLGPYSLRKELMTVRNSEVRVVGEEGSPSYCKPLEIYFSL